MIKQFSRKMEKQDILNLKSAESSHALNGLPHSQDRDAENKKEKSASKGQYKPGLLEQRFNQPYLSKNASSTESDSLFLGKEDNSPYFSKVDKKKSDI